MKHNKTNIPDFIVIGAMRAGTTTLQGLLSNIDQISLARMKETDFFIKEKNFSRGLSWYTAQFDKSKKIWGEISPSYTKRDVFKGVPERVFKANPKTKLIYILRDPIDRAISQYQFSYLFGQKMPTPENFFSSHEGQHIIDTSRYAYQIKPWIETFGRNSILFIDFKFLCDAPQDQINQITKFLGLDDTKSFKFNDRENTSENLGATPLWYLELRNTKIVTTLRALLPRKVAKMIKSFVSKKNPTRKAPELPETVIQEMKKVLKNDAKELRKISGMTFSHWKV